MTTQHFGWLSALALVSLAGHPAIGQDEAVESPEPVKQRPNLRAPTLGGREFWGDVFYCSGWKIQQHYLLKHYRLLNSRDVRFAWGTKEQCLARFEQLRRDRQIEPMTGEVVVLVHGIVRSSKSMHDLQTHLQEAGYAVVPFDYPSTRVSIEESAEYLHQVVASLTDAERIHLVGHSMGGLVIRAYQSAHESDRIGRVVMLATPNQGAELAEKLQPLPLYRWLFGLPGQQLSRKHSSFLNSLPAPTTEFAIIAGGRSNEKGFSRLIPGDDDFIVGVDRTKLAGSADFRVVDAKHNGLLHDPTVMHALTHFLKTGRLTDEPSLVSASAN